MNKEQRKRMAYRTIVQEDEGQADIEYTVQVSGDRVEIHRDYEDDEGETEDTHDTWTMRLDVFKRLLEAGQWCIEKSEAFERSHPQEGGQ